MEVESTNTSQRNFCFPVYQPIDTKLVKNYTSEYADMKIKINNMKTKIFKIIKYGISL